MVHPSLTEFALNCLDRKLSGESAPEVCHLKYIVEPEGRCCCMQANRVGDTYRCMAGQSIKEVKEKIRKGYSLREVNQLLVEKIDALDEFLDDAQKQDGLSVLKTGSTVFMGYKE